MNFMTFHILGRIPPDFHIFQRGWNHQPEPTRSSYDPFDDPLSRDDISLIYYPLVNKQLDPENHHFFLMETSLPTPMTARVELLIYQRVQYNPLQPIIIPWYPYHTSIKPPCIMVLHHLLSRMILQRVSDMNLYPLVICYIAMEAMAHL